MRTSLINPPPIQGEAFIREGRCMQSVDSWAAIWPPLTLAILAAVARRFGEVDLFDCNVEEGYDVARTVERVTEFRPDVVVVNTAFPSIEADARCAAEIKQACPDALVVGFGVFFTLLDDKSMKECPAFDVAIRGEPEATFEELIQTLEADKPIAGILGLMWRDGDAVRMAESRPFISNLDDLPFAARDLLHNHRYTLPTNGHRFTLINVARGCPYPCIFCIAPVYYGRPLRRHSLEYVLNELEYCQNELGITDFLFWEEIFTLDRKFGMALCEAILDKGWKISWATTTRADRVDEEILSIMKKAGCSLLGLGIESSSQEILDNADKRETVEDIENAVRLAQKVGLKTMGHFIFGLPGETPETAATSIDFGVKLGLDYMQCYAAVPYPKTRLGEMARKKGWVNSTRWAEYDFGGRSIIDTGSIAPEKVDEARRNMFRRFYLRPAYMLGQVGGMLRNPRQILQASKFINWMRTREKPAS
jgi:radical SAM superfamily enzyme YgiQ (UPF0313 family)